MDKSRKTYYQKNKERLKAKQREYYQNNIEKCREKGRQYWANNSEKYMELPHPDQTKRIKLKDWEKTLMANNVEINKLIKNSF